jgi:hypothetical protein
LVGASIPAFLEIRFPGIRAGGALVIFALIYLANPPKLTYEALPRNVSLKESAQLWSQPRKRHGKSDSPDASVPIRGESIRADFEKAWRQSSVAERRATDPSLLYKAMSLAAKTHRVEEDSSEEKATTLYWSDAAIAEPQLTVGD